MASPDENSEAQPIMQPRLIRTLKNRNRIIDFGWREEVLDQAEDVIEQRRHPDTVAERMVQHVKQTAEGAGEPVIRNRMKNRVNQVNDTVLDNL